MARSALVGRLERTDDQGHFLAGGSGNGHSLCLRDAPSSVLRLALEALHAWRWRTGQLSSVEDNRMPVLSLWACSCQADACAVFRLCLAQAVPESAGSARVGERVQFLLDSTCRAWGQ